MKKCLHFALMQRNTYFVNIMPFYSSLWQLGQDFLPHRPAHGGNVAPPGLADSALPPTRLLMSGTP